eukprot:63924-Amphidinium_carterae.3
MRWARSGDCPKFKQTLCCWWRHFLLSYGKQLELASAEVEEDEDGRHELGDVEPALGDVEEEELDEEVCAGDDEVEDVWEGEEAVLEEDVADVQANSKETCTLSRSLRCTLHMAAHAAQTLQQLLPPHKYEKGHCFDYLLHLTKSPPLEFKMAWRSGLRAWTSGAKSIRHGFEPHRGQLHYIPLKINFKKDYMTVALQK